LSPPGVVLDSMGTWTPHLQNMPFLKHKILNARHYVKTTDDTGKSLSLVRCLTLVYYIDCLKKELGRDNSTGNLIYTRLLTKEEIMDNHRSFMGSIGSENDKLVFIHSTGYLSCSLQTVLILPSVPNAPRNLFPWV